MAVPPIPTYQDPVEVNPRTKKGQFSTVWLNWFLQLTNGNIASTVSHNNLSGLQGGSANQYYHLTSAQYSSIVYRNTGAPTGITVTASPFNYHNVDGFEEDVIVQGGSTTLIEFSRNGTTYYTIGLTNGMFHLSPGDYLRVTYPAAAPTMTKVPR